MSIQPDLLHKIMGGENSPTGRLVALRRSPGDTTLETGVWYSDFSRVQRESRSRNLPMIAVWTNGDLCEFCRRFTENILTDRFRSWMASSNCLFWLGGSMDELSCDIRGGDGFKWCMGTDGKVNYFPFVSVEKYGSYSYHGSGHDFDNRKLPPDGDAATIQKITDILSGHISVPSHAAVPAEGPRLSVQAVVPDGEPAEGRLTIRINPEWDADHVRRFMAALKEHGGHCPCCANESVETMCMCSEFLRLGTEGRCRCGAFEKYVAWGAC